MKATYDMEGGKWRGAGVADVERGRGVTKGIEGKKGKQEM